MFGCLFFFKRKTAYEMVGSDWSSDVCSSDLAGPPACASPTRPRKQEGQRHAERELGSGGDDEVDDGRGERAPEEGVGQHGPVVLDADKGAALRAAGEVREADPDLPGDWVREDAEHEQERRSEQ